MKIIFNKKTCQLAVTSATKYNVVGIGMYSKKKKNSIPQRDI